MKSTPVQDVAVPTIDPRQRVGTTSPKESRGEGLTQSAPNINNVLSNQLKQQLLSKPAVTSTTNKPSPNLAGSDAPAINNNNNNGNTNVNNNNKNFSGNANKDAVSHRTSQKKDPRLSSNSSGILNGNSSKNTQSLSVGSNSSPSAALSASNRGSGGSDSKSKDSKSSKDSRSSSSSSTADKSSTSSKSSHRKIGNKSRSKPPQSNASKTTKLDRDSSPIRSKSREKDSGDNSPSSSRTSPQSSSFQASKNRKKNTKSRKRSPSPPYRIPRRNDAKSSSSLNSSGGVTEEEQSGSLIVSPPHPPTFKEIRPNARQRNYVRRNKDGSLSPEHSPASAGNAQTATEPTLELSSKDEDLRAPLSLPGTAVSVQSKSTAYLTTLYSYVISCNIIFKNLLSCNNLIVHARVSINFHMCFL